MKLILIGINLKSPTCDKMKIAQFREFRPHSSDYICVLRPSTYVCRCIKYEGSLIYPYGQVRHTKKKL